MPTHKRPKQPPIAIVGIGCLFPNAPDLTAYWREIIEANDCISDVPEEHSWTASEHYSEDPNQRDRTWCTRGGFLDKVPFDPMAFGIPPNMLESIDTTQLLSLIVARETLRDAGVDPDAEDWNRERTACIIGITGTQELAVSLGSRLRGPIWKKAMLRCGVDERVADTVVEDIGNHLPTWTEQSFPGLLGNVVAGRIANRLNLGGTNCVVDAACASSLAAIQYAIGDLVSGRSDLVLSGGADTLNDTFMFQCFTRTPAFTKKGDARPFDAEADGILIGEGIAMVALKRLEDAERDGDRVYAVIKGLGSSSDGRFKSIYAPNSSGQAKALRRTYEMAEVETRTIELVEAHGTGTKAGDVAEIAGLKAVYSDGERTDRRIAIGSVKSQIGHTKSTAGAAGLVKAALALHQKVLPPTAKIDQPNPKMSFEKSPFYLSPRARPWIRAADHPRRAAVSAFGFGGSNFHAVLEEHGDTAVRPMWAAEAELFLFGADSVAALTEQLEAAVTSEAPTLAHRARECQSAWKPAANVLAFVATAANFADQVAIAGRALQGERVRGVHLGTGLKAPKVGFLFPGQGSQYVEMGRTVAIRHPVVRAAYDAADEAFRVAGRGSISQMVFPPPTWTDAAAKLDADALRQTEWAQPAIGAFSTGLLDLVRSFGIEPTAVAGHSYGELVALHAAGVLSADELWEASRVRGEAMSASDRDRGTMAAVNGPLDEIAAVLAGLDSDVLLANRNHPEQGVISGGRDDVAAALEALAEVGLNGKELRVAAAFHSNLVADAQKPLTEALERIEFAAPQVPVYANATAAPYPAKPEEARQLLADQIVTPVDFVGIVRGMVEAGIETFIEIGPRGVLTGLVRNTLKSEAGTLVALDGLHSREDGDSQLKEALAVLAAAGVPLHVEPLLAERLPIAPRLPGSKATVWLNGANHLNETTKNPPMPKNIKPPAPPPPTPFADGWGAIPSSGAPIGKPPALAKSTTTPAPAELPQTLPHAPTAPVAQLPAGDLGALLASTRQTLEAFQQAQERTAAVHAQFLDAYAKSSENFTRLFETHARLVQMATSGTNATAPAPLPSFEAPAPPPVVAPSPAEATPIASGWESGRVAPPTVHITSVAASDDLPPIFDAQAAVDHSSASRPQTAPGAVGPSRDDVVQVTLQAVADKTGYPRDMLELEMDLESDLGVDSIKRVEILSAVQEQIPGLPELDNDRMSALRTLQEVVDVLLESSGAPAPTNGAPSPGISREVLAAAMMAAVAAKTGYPLDMLEPAMDLESDLGVDSIKRVEILSAVQEEVAGLPELDNDKMSGLRTLDEVVGYLAEVAAAPVPFSEGIFSTPKIVAREDLIAAMLDSVAEKTGYPRDMLDLAMDLESDLGVDSIKRVEILSAVSERIPELPELDNETLSSLRTLQEVIDHLASVGAGLGFASIGSARPVSPIHIVPPAAPAVLPKPAAGLPPVQVASDIIEDQPLSLRRRVVQVVPAQPGAFSVSGRIVVTADSGDLAGQVLEALTARGVDALLLDPDWTSAETVAQALPSGVSGAIHLATVGASDVRTKVRGAFLLAKAIGPCELFATVSAMGGTFGLESLRGDPLQGALAGLAKTLSHEWPQTRAVALDVGDGVTGADIDAALFGLTDTEIGLKPEPFALRTVSATRGAAGREPLDKGDLVVVSGGARGVTAAVITEVARRYQPAFLLLGRSELPDEPHWAEGVSDSGLKAAYLTHEKASGNKPTPRELNAACQKVSSAREVRHTLRAIESAGSSATYRAVDVRDDRRVAEAISTEVAQRGRVRGLIHGAGVLADKLLVDKTEQAFDSVFSTKVDGLASLLAAVDVAELKVFSVFSSVAGRFGNLGQSDYAMANEALTHTALRLAHEGVLSRSFDWGPWDGGMVTPALKRQFEARGHTVIPMELGAAFFCDELENGEVVEVVVEGPRPSSGQLERTFHVDTDGYLRDHTISDSPVVPVAVVLEWMAQTAREIYPALRPSAVRDMAVLKGITLGDDGVAVRLDWQPAAARDGMAALHFQILGDPGPLGIPVIHYRAVVDLTPEFPAGEAFPGTNGLGANELGHSVEEAYDRYLFHGPMFHGIDEIVGISDQGMVAVAHASAPGDLGRAGKSWQTDPLVVDCAMQLMVLWVRAKKSSAALPSFVKEYRQYRPFEGRIACHLEFSQASETRGRFQATMVDESGDIVAILSDAEYTADRSLGTDFQPRG